MTAAQFVAYFESRVGPREKTDIEPEEVEALIPSALQRATEEIAQSEHATDLQREDALVLDGSGIATIPGDFLPGYISSVRHSSSTLEFDLYQSRSELTHRIATEFGGAAIENGKIYTSPPDGTDAPLTGDLNVTGIFIPVIGTWPSKHDGVLLDAVVELAQERWKFNRVGRDPKPAPIVAA